MFRLAALCLLALPACTAPATHGLDGRVAGHVTYLPRIALPPDAVLHLELVDLSHADAPAVPVGRRTIEAPGQIPIAFEVRYVSSAIHPEHVYVITARITAGERLLFQTAAQLPVITSGTPDDELEVLVQLADG